MNEWTLLLRLVVCGTGVLVFLHFVAARVSASGEALDALEKRENRAWKQREAERDEILAIDADGVVVGVEE